LLITSCVTTHGNCDATERCSIKEPLRRVNESILGVLGTVTVAQLTEETSEPTLVGLKGLERLAVTG
jgi:DNA-binding IscR family transcriptional regulator